jgi:cholesterol oxidase
MTAIEGAVAPTPANDREAHDADFIVVGSGFGGAVSALRLAEKGYRVVVLEAGKRWQPEEFPRTNWRLDKFLWLPALGWYGIQRIAWLRDVVVLAGAGVGGGSLVYANTLLKPPPEFFRDPRWARLEDWETRLAPHYAEALRMLGATPSAFLGPSDRALRAVAEEMGRGDTFHQPTVAVYFGEAGKTVPDPFFGGAGPDRTGCNFCGGCMVGCRHGAKNTLDRNYLFLAEKLGAVIHPLTTVEKIEAIDGDPRRGYRLTSRRTGGFLSAPQLRVWRAPQVVLAAGVLGTTSLLLRARERGWLPALSAQLGEEVRTNSEALVGAIARGRGVDQSRGIAITSGFWPEPNTHVEIVRYGAGQDAMGRLATLLTAGGAGRWRRRLSWLGGVLRHPLDFLRTLWPWGWARATTILLVMQNLDSKMRLTLRKGVLSSARGDASPPPAYIPAAHLVARRMADKTDGIAIGSLTEALLDVPLTAHILGGCPMGEDATQGVIDRDHQVFGYPGLYVCDGSAVSANLGVNPALTICALTENAMSKIPVASARAPRRNPAYRTP